MTKSNYRLGFGRMTNASLHMVLSAECWWTWYASILCRLHVHILISFFRHGCSIFHLNHFYYRLYIIIFKTCIFSYLPNVSWCLIKSHYCSTIKSEGNMGGTIIIMCLEDTLLLLIPISCLWNTSKKFTLNKYPEHIHDMNHKGIWQLLCIDEQQ